MMQKATILDIPVDTIDMPRLLAMVSKYIASGTPHHLVTVNIEFIMEARRNPVFKRVLCDADIALADGAGVLLAAKLLRQPTPPRVPGVDFVQALAHLSAEKHYRMFLLGGRDGVGEQAAEILKANYPGLQIVGTYEGSPTDKEVMSHIQTTHPDILLVAWGAPKQDIWIAENKKKLGVPIMMGVGGSYDFIAGKAKRAPVWMREVGLEWFWRLLKEPWRWKRQLALPQAFITILLIKLHLIKH